MYFNERKEIGATSSTLQKKYFHFPTLEDESGSGGGPEATEPDPRLNDIRCPLTGPAPEMVCARSLRLVAGILSDSGCDV